MCSASLAAVVGAAIALVFATSDLSLFALGGFIGASIVSGSLVWLTQTNRWSTYTILLVGIALNLFSASLLSIVLFVAEERASTIILG